MDGSNKNKLKVCDYRIKAADIRLTLTLCRSIGFMMVPWKNSTVVKCLLKRPSSSRSGGFLHILTVTKKCTTRAASCLVTYQLQEFLMLRIPCSRKALVANPRVCKCLQTFSKFSISFIGKNLHTINTLRSEKARYNNTRSKVKNVSINSG